MGTYEEQLEAEEREDAAALAEVQDLILRVAAEHRPDSLGELRNWLYHAGGAEVNPALLRAALWILLSEDRLHLASDRTLRVSE